MKKFNIASTLTDINDLYIAEAADMPYASAATPTGKRKNAFSRFANSGWGVAMICGVVALSVTFGVWMMGRNTDPVTPSANPTAPTSQGTPTVTEPFAFSYSITPSQATYKPGDKLTVTTEIENLGESFTVKGSTQAFTASAWLIPHGSTDVKNAEGKINGNFARYDDYVIQTVETGDVGRHKGSILLPETASGSYDLVLSYEEHYQVFENAVTVGKDPAVSYQPTISCTDTPKQDAYAPGDSFDLPIVITGVDPQKLPVSENGKPMEPEGYPLFATLAPHDAEDGSIGIQGVFVNKEPDPNDPTLLKLHFTLPVALPSNASGWYDLYVSWADEEVSFPKQLHVTENGFRFTYEISRVKVHFGDTVSVSATVQNLGAPFEITGHSLEFSPRIVFKHKYHGDVLEVNCAYPDDYLTRTVETGEIGSIQGFLAIPEDARAGWYDICLSFGDTEKTIGGGLYIQPPEVPPITVEEALEIANQFMQSKDLPIPLERMESSTYEFESYYSVHYIYRLGAFQTAYQFRIDVNYDGSYSLKKSTEWDPEAYYAVYTDEDVLAACERLEAKMSDALGDRFPSAHWSGSLKEKDGKLYIKAETIVDCEHGPDCEGLLGENNCCEGHEHHSFEEEVTKITA